MKTILEAIDLCKYYGEGESLVKAVDGVNLRIAQGEFVTIIGKSGSGKSTLLHLMGGLEIPTSGKVLIDGKNIASMNEERQLGTMSIDLIKSCIYVILIMIAVTGFMNLINTMITSISTRKREIGVLQAIGLSDRQLTRMLSGEGAVFTAGTLILSFTVGNIFGYLIFLWAKSKHVLSVYAYHYPVIETICLAAALTVGQLIITWLISKRVRRESLIDRIRSGE